MFEQFFKVIAEIGFEQEARRRLIQPVVLFITDSAPVTAQSYAELRRRLELTIVVPVHNEAISFMFIPADFPPSSTNCDTIGIPRLAPLVRGVIDKPGFSFGAHMKSQAGGPTQVHSWIGSVFAKSPTAADYRPAGIILRGIAKKQIAGRGQSLSPAGDL